MSENSLAAILAAAGFEVTMSDGLDKLAAALVATQGSIPGIAKSGKANYGPYMTLDDILKAVKPVLFANGLAVLQPVSASQDGSSIGVTTMFLHASGQFVAATSYFPTEKGRMTTAQAAGSSVTYQKRYGLAAMLGINSDVDNDGNLTPAELAAIAERYVYGDGSKVADHPAARAAFDAHVEVLGMAPETSKALQAWDKERKSAK